VAKNILSTIKERLAHLPKAERKIADYVLAKPLDVIQMNAKDLANKAKASPASVVRFCHSIGIGGFTELKLALSAQSNQWTEDHYTDILPDENLARIKEKLAVNTTIVLEETNETLSDELVEETVTKMMASPMIYVYGIGASYLVAMDLRQKFTRIGKHVIVSQDQHELVASMAIAEIGSIYIGISYSGEKRDGIKMMEAAKKWGLQTIALTKASDNSLSRLADIALQTAETNEALLRSGATFSLLSQLYAVDVLFFHYMTKDYDGHVKNLELSRKATDVYD
jgi:DNA-binding MurR/RpiR family transcriptional regulator